MTDFRDHHIKKALDEAVGAYLPEAAFCMHCGATLPAAPEEGATPGD